MMTPQFGKVISVDERAQRSKFLKLSGLVRVAVTSLASSSLASACAHSRRLGGNVWARIGK